MRYLGGFRGEGARPWLLQIVRNTCWTWLKANRPAENVGLDDGDGAHDIAAPAADEPPQVAMRRADRVLIDQAIAALPAAFREVLVLRELEDLSYADIARIAEIPIGTVMSRLARARAQMRSALAPVAARPVLRPVPKVALTAAEIHTWVLHAPDVDAARKPALEALGVRLCEIPKGAQGRIDRLVGYVEDELRGLEYACGD